MRKVEKDEFDPGAPGMENGNLFGFPHTEVDSAIIVHPVPWEVTVSYHHGTSSGPSQILKASPQLDFFDLKSPKGWEKGIYLLPESKEIRRLNGELMMDSHKLISHLETGTPLLSLGEQKHILDKVLDGCQTMNQMVYNQAEEILKRGKIPGVIGGDHSTPLGQIKAVSDAYPDLSILQIDAHADLRKGYEGFKYSHASIMHNVLSESKVKKLVQVGIRDLSHDEFDYIEKDDRITTFFEEDYKAKIMAGDSTWSGITEEVMKALSDTVYVSFDIDGLDPALCPHTGTPVPGGLSFNEAKYLLQSLKKHGKKVVGFDLCEVSNGPFGDWDANVGSRILFQMLLTV